MISSQGQFLQVAFNSYDNPKLVLLSEFEADLKRFSYLDVMISKYQESPDDRKLRIILNHVVILNNCFRNRTSELIFFKISELNKLIAMTVMVFLKMIETDEYNSDLLNKLETL